MRYCRAGVPGVGVPRDLHRALQGGQMRGWKQQSLFPDELRCSACLSEAE